MKKLAVLGSTGSIGRQTLDVVRQTGCARIVALSANENTDLLLNQMEEFNPEVAVITNLAAYEKLKETYKGPVCLKFGMDGLLDICSGSADMVLNALVGSMGLSLTIAAIDNKKELALANKESLVAGGRFVMERAANAGVSIIPVDSEHSAIYQCLLGQEKKSLRRILLTGSGGAFLGKTKEELSHVTVNDALHHPNWAMGKKITIDSATLMNKGLEVIEASYLFGVSPDKIQVVIHPQSIVHSMVEFNDGTVMAQMSVPDMRLPILFAITGKRLHNSVKKLDLFELRNLSFMPPDTETFPCLALAYKALKHGGVSPCIINGANESAVSRFLAGNIGFLKIYDIIETTIKAYNGKQEPTDLAGILAVDEWAKKYALYLNV